MSDNSRLSRWSRRKLAARRGGALPEPADLETKVLRKERDDEAQGSTGHASLPADTADASATREEMLTEEDLPPVDELTAQSDYTAFLKKNVPEALRRRALRKLWVSDPVFANLDGLNDYDEDFAIVEAMTMDDTIYKIGRGFLTDEDLKEPGEGEPTGEEHQLTDQSVVADRESAAIGESTVESEGSDDESVDDSREETAAALQNGTAIDDLADAKEQSSEETSLTAEEDTREKESKSGTDPTA